MRYDIIDCDTHITEPRDVWTSRVPARYVEQVPHVVRNDAGVDIWLLTASRSTRPGSRLSRAGPSLSRTDRRRTRTCTRPPTIPCPA